MWDPILVANDVPTLKDEPAIRRRMVYRKFNKCFDPKQLAERQAQDPDVVGEKPHAVLLHLRALELVVGRRRVVGHLGLIDRQVASVAAVVASAGGASAAG
jgi:hypothetical protein